MRTGARRFGRVPSLLYHFDAAVLGAPFSGVVGGDGGGGGVAFHGCDEPGPYHDSLGAESEGSGKSAAVGDSTCGDDGCRYYRFYNTRLSTIVPTVPAM